jgi:hypothetical protein
LTHTIRLLEEATMKKTLMAALLLLCTALIWAAPADNFESGGLEFGGELHISFFPAGYITDADSREANEGQYDLFVDATASIGWFPLDRFSLQLMPGVFYRHNVDNNGDDVAKTLNLSLGAGCDYYLTAGSSLAFSAGLDLGATIIPGIYGTSGGTEAPDDSMAVLFTVSPNLAAYYFISERVAPYISLCPELYNRVQIKNIDGSDYEYPPDKGFMSYWQLMLKVNVGIKFFLPSGSRFLGGRERSLTEETKINS